MVGTWLIYFANHLVSSNLEIYFILSVERCTVYCVVYTYNVIRQRSFQNATKLSQNIFFLHWNGAITSREKTSCSARSNLSVRCLFIKKNEWNNFEKIYIPFRSVPLVQIHLWQSCLFFVLYFMTIYVVFETKLDRYFSANVCHEL